MSEELKSRLDRTTWLWLLPMGALIVVPFVLLYKKMQEGFYSWETLGYYLILPVFTGLSLWVLLDYYWKRAPKLIITPSHLKIGKQVISFQQIAKIRLFVPNMAVSECSTIILKTGEEFKLGISLYKNGPVIRENLNRIKTNLKYPDKTIALQLELMPVRTYKIRDLREYETFKQTIFKSFITYSSWPFILFTAYLFLTNPSFPTLILFLFVGLVLGFPIVFQSFFFLLSDNYFTIKNAYIPGWQKSFSRQDILRANHIIGNRRADGLKLTFSNYQTKTYLSSLLSSDMYSELENQLSRKRAINFNA